MNITAKLVSSFAAGFIVGGVGAYFVTKKKLESYYADISQRDINEMREHYSLLRKQGVYSTPEQAVTARHGMEYVQSVQELGYSKVPTMNAQVDYESQEDEETMADDSIIAINVFDSPVDDNIEDGEDDIRDPDRPYIISVDEFMEHDQEIDGIVYDKITITYFDEDHVLIDEREEVIPDIDKVIGDTFMTKFGHKSKDKNVVYVRNERLESDFEVLLDKMSYSESVLGFHKDKKITKRFREDE